MDNNRNGQIGRIGTTTTGSDQRDRHIHIDLIILTLKLIEEDVIVTGHRRHKIDGRWSAGNTTTVVVVADRRPAIGRVNSDLRIEGSGAAGGNSVGVPGYHAGDPVELTRPGLLGNYRVSTTVGAAPLR